MEIPLVSARHERFNSHPIKKVSPLGSLLYEHSRSLPRDEEGATAPTLIVLIHLVKSGGVLIA